jgi:hypothetical protein
MISSLIDFSKTSDCRTTLKIMYRRNHIFVRFEVFMAVTIKNGVFWNVTLYGSCENRRFGGT